MSYQPSALRKELIISLCIFTACFLSVVIAGILVKLFFSTILWLLNGEFELTWHEVFRGIKIAGVGGLILGGGMVLFRLLKVKGF
ncbi:hypothetical protein ACMGGR_16975 [Erwinia sp. BNK-24-b]|uniref:hypothetical protein n=1 Tax=unclassified Erwinia TaxID=2622719 RepID=UPI0039BF2984